MLVVVLLLTAVSTGVPAREFRAADTQNEEYPTVQALRDVGQPGRGAQRRPPPDQGFHSRQPGEEKEPPGTSPVGAIDPNRTNVALIGTMLPAMNVLATPFLFRTIAHQRKLAPQEASQRPGPTCRLRTRISSAKRRWPGPASAHCAALRWRN
ncbi:hypothetical protein ACFIOY_07770 [Bradyrhizobium sp. TZ2]